MNTSVIEFNKGNRSTLMQSLKFYFELKLSMLNDKARKNKYLFLIKRKLKIREERNFF